MISDNNLGERLLRTALREQRDMSLLARLAGRPGVDIYWHARIDERVSIAKWDLDADLLLVQAVRNEIGFLRLRDVQATVEALR